MAMEKHAGRVEQLAKQSGQQGRGGWVSLGGTQGPPSRGYSSVGAPTPSRGYSSVGAPTVPQQGTLGGGMQGAIVQGESSRGRGSAAKAQEGAAKRSVAVVHAEDGGGKRQRLEGGGGGAAQGAGSAGEALVRGSLMLRR